MLWIGLWIIVGLLSLLIAMYVEPTRPLELGWGILITALGPLFLWLFYVWLTMSF